MQEASFDLRTHGTRLLLKHKVWLNHHRMNDARGDGGQSYDGQVTGKSSVGAQSQLGAIVTVNIDSTDCCEH